MIGIKAVNETMNMGNLHKKLSQLRMTSYPATCVGARPLPLAKRGEVFSKAEKLHADKVWKERYIN